MDNILPVDNHAWNLDCILRTINMNELDETWEHISSWLQMASGLDKVNLITEKFDSSLSYCSSALSFEDKRSNMLSDLAKELTVFSFIWGAFESLIETLEPLISGCNIDKYGKVSTARYILRRKHTPALSGYTESLDKLLKLYGSLFTSNINLDKLRLNEKGLFIVYKIRNKFAHGAFSFPFDPEDYPDPELSHTALVNISSTIILLTMQMLLCSYFNVKNIELTHLFLFDWLYEKESILLNTLLESIHLNNFQETFENE